MSKATNLGKLDIFEAVLKGPTWLAAFILFTLMSMTFLDVILRSAAGNPIESATELTRIFMAIIVFASLPLVSWKGEHIVVDLMDPLFSESLSMWRNSLVDLICGIAILWPSFRVWELAERSHRYGDRTEYLHFPEYFVAYFIATFSFMTAVSFLVRGVAQIISDRKFN